MADFNYEDIIGTATSKDEAMNAGMTEDMLDPSYGIGDMLFDGIQATFPFVQSSKHVIPLFSNTYDEEFDRVQFYKEEYPKLDPTIQTAIDHAGGARSRSFVNTIIARQQDEMDIQQRMYDYGGLTGSIGTQLVGSLLNPIEWGIAAATFGGGKYVATAKMIRDVTNKSRTTRVVGAGALGAAEGAVAGYASEVIRQETGGIYDADARRDVTLFGTVLGGTLGASGWVKFLNEQDINVADAILRANDRDSIATGQGLNGEYNPNLSLGAGEMRWRNTPYDIDDFNTMPRAPFQGLSFLSPRGRSYGVMIPAYREVLEKLANPDVALKNPDGTWHTMRNKTAEEIQSIDFDGFKGDLANEIAGSFHMFNKTRVAQGLPKMDEADWGELLYKERVQYNMVHRELQAEIDYLKTKVDEAGELSQETKVLIRRLEETEPNYNFTYPEVERANAALNTYFGQMEYRRTASVREKRIAKLEAKPNLTEAETRELQSLRAARPTESKSYTTRILNKKRFKNDWETKDRLLQAMLNSPTGRAIRKYGTTAEIRAYELEMRKVVENMVKKLNEAETLQTLGDLIELKTGAKGDIGTGKFSIGRRIDIDENMMGDMLQTDMHGIVDSYHRDTSGRLAIREAFKDDGIETWNDFKDKYWQPMAEQMDFANMSATKKAQALLDLKKVFETVRGTADIQSNPDHWFNVTSKILTTYQNIRNGLGFGMTSLSELGPAMAVGGVQTLKYIRPALVDSINKINNKEIASEFIQELQGMGIGVDLQNGKVIERFSEGRADFEANKVVNLLRKGENAAFRYGGLTLITDTLKSAIGGAYTARLINLGKRLDSDPNYKLGGHLDAMFARHGLTNDDLISLSKNKHISFDENGLLTAFNFEKWPEAEAIRIKTAITRVVSGNILEPKAMDIPWDTKDPLHSLIFQYLRFPIAAMPKLLQKGLAEKDIAAVGGAMVSTLVIAGNAYLEAQVASKVGEVLGITSDEGKYSDIWEDTDQQKAMATEIWRKHPYLGAVPTLVDTVLTVSGNAPIGTTYKPGIGGLAGAGIQQASQLAQAASEVITEPGTLTKNQIWSGVGLTGILGVPYLGELTKNYLKEEF